MPICGSLIPAGPCDRHRGHIGAHRVDHPRPTIEMFDPPIGHCPLCGHLAICELPPVLLAKQTDGTTLVCHPLHGGCNHGFARDDDAVPRPGLVTADTETPTPCEGSPESASATVGDLRVTVRLRAPRAGEFGWWVDADASAPDALTSAIQGRTYERDVEGHGFGWIAFSDYTDREFDDDDDTRAVTVTVEPVGRDA